MSGEPLVIEELEHAANWRLRMVDADPADEVSARAAALLHHIADDLRRNDYPALWAELGAIDNWLGESDAISDFAELAFDYRARIGAADHPANGADYLRGLLAIARSLL